MFWREEKEVLTQSCLSACDAQAGKEHKGILGLGIFFLVETGLKPVSTLREDW